jgi:hypothetical protein
MLLVPGRCLDIFFVVVFREKNMVEKRALVHVECITNSSDLCFSCCSNKSVASLYIRILQVQETDAS